MNLSPSSDIFGYGMMGIIRRLSTLAICLLTGSLFSLCLGQNLVSELRNNEIQILAPGDAGFESACAAFNRRFTFQPTAVTFPQTQEQISTIVRTAAKYGTHVSARSGGHNYIANGLGGQIGTLVVDLNRYLTDIQFNTVTNTARVQTGSRLGDIALTLNREGRGIGHGTCPYVGIGGHASFGGFGFSSRMWGMAMDAIVEMEVVLANGSAGMRGAGPSFGITTSITIQTFPVPPSATVFIYTWDMTAEKASTALQAYQSFSLGHVPPEFGSEFFLFRGSSQGRVGVKLQGVWYGDADKFEETVGPLLLEIGEQPQDTQVIPGTYIDSVSFYGSGQLNTTEVPDGTDEFYAKSLLTPESQPVSARSWDAFAKYLATDGFSANLNWFIEVGGPGSAVNAIPVQDTSFVTRDALFLIQLYGNTDGFNITRFPSFGFTLVDEMVDGIVKRMPFNWPYHAYPNYLDNRLRDWQQLYFGQNYERLQGLKASVDPKDMFHFPTSIELP